MSKPIVFPVWHAKVHKKIIGVTPRRKSLDIIGSILESPINSSSFVSAEGVMCFSPCALLRPQRRPGNREIIILLGSSLKATRSSFPHFQQIPPERLRNLNDRWSASSSSLGRKTYAAVAANISILLAFVAKARTKENIKVKTQTRPSRILTL